MKVIESLVKTYEELNTSKRQVKTAENLVKACKKACEKARKAI